MIKVVITEWQVPFDQVVTAFKEFLDDKVDEALNFINAESKKWWETHEGSRCLVEIPDTEPYAPITELGHDVARYELWDGETGFHAMLDAKSDARLHEAHYKREYDDKGIKRPGYLINCYVAEGEDGEHVGSAAKHEEYVRQQAEGLAELDAWRKPN